MNFKYAFLQKVNNFQLVFRKTSKMQHLKLKGTSLAFNPQYLRLRFSSFLHHNLFIAYIVYFYVLGATGNNVNSFEQDMTLGRGKKNHFECFKNL